MKNLGTRTHQVTIGEILDGYEEDIATKSVTGLAGMLNIRPPYQREYLHATNPQFKVNLIESILYERPIGLIYFAQVDGGMFEYELLDGLQRIYTIGQFYQNKFSVQFNGISNIFAGLDKDVQENFLNYELLVRECWGGHAELMKWFEIINSGVEKLHPQEIRNAVYNGPWVNDAKKYFSSPKREGNYAEQCGKYMGGKRDRQGHLEKVIKWRIGSTKHDQICDYMLERRGDESAKDLWHFYEDLFRWIERTFSVDCDVNYRKNEMQRVDWGALYREYSHKSLDMVQIAEIERTVNALFKLDPKEIKYPGIYKFALSGNENDLRKGRVFTDEMKRQAYERQGGICPLSKKKMDIEDMEADHDTPWIEGGLTNADNCQMICKEKHKAKTTHDIAKWRESQRQ